MLTDTPTSTMTVDNCHDNNQRSLNKDWKGECISSGSKPHPWFQKTHEYPPTLSSSLPFTLTLLYIWCLHPNGVEKSIWELGSCFSILQPLNKACALPVSASVSLLAEWIWSEKVPSWTRLGSRPRLGPCHGFSWPIQ